MPRFLFVATFVLLALAFVPVLLHLGLVAFIIPAACIFVSGTVAFLKANWAQALWMFGHFGVYLLVFYLAARVAFRLSVIPVSPKVRLRLQMAALVAVFACSFLRVLTYSSIRGSGGTYTFWSAVVRFFERMSPP